MRSPSSAPAAPVGRLKSALLAIGALCLIPSTNAFNFTAVPSPNLNLNDLGRVAFAGHFDSISLYQFEGQTESNNNGTAAVLSRFPNGLFQKIAQSDGDIKAMCAYTANNTLQGIVIGGNFTGFGDDLKTPGGIVLLNPNTGKVTPLEGLNGSVNALYCDNGKVYVGGSFSGGGANNAIAWTTDWTNMPFAGFNGPVTSIAKYGDNIVFGGKFNGLGNSSAPRENNTQIVPLNNANITAQTSSGRPGFTEPKDIICKTSATDGSSGGTWLLADNVPGFWRADFGFGFQPSKLRLFNTKFEGRGTKTFRYTALPDGGIMNFTYTDPSTGQQAYCDARCPLPEKNTTAQDFRFVNKIGMNAFRIDISEFYGQGGGLSGIELFQDDVYSFAINDFNGATCDGVTTDAKSTSTGPWAITPSGQSNSNYLTARLTGTNIDPSSATVVFQPNIPQSGNYSVTVYTPGCQGDNTCENRGRVNITGSMTSKTSSSNGPLSTELYQTNKFDKYDQVYFGYIDKSDGFKPTVTLAPMPGQSGPLVVVAQRVRFELLTPTSGNLNGLFEYNPNQQTVDNDFTKSVIDTAGASLSPRDQALVTSLVANADRVYVGGNFSGDNLNNFFAIDKKGTVALPGNGLNNQVMATYTNDTNADLVYVGGNFTNTQDGKTPGLAGVGAFSVKDNKWQPLGAGVNGVVTYIVPFTLNITANNAEEVLGISGFFDSVNKFGNNASFSVDNFAVWVPSRQNWLQNLNVQRIALQGALMAMTKFDAGKQRLYAGSISSQQVSSSGAVGLNYGNDLSLQSYPLSIKTPQPQGSLHKRATTTNGRNQTGIVTAQFFHDNGLNVTILGGHFTTTGSDGSNITNLMFIDGKDSDRVAGLHEEIEPTSIFQALGTLGNILFAGGYVSGTVNKNRIGGLLAYDLGTKNYAPTQPPALQGQNVSVNAIAPRPKTKDVFVGGQFDSAGALNCPALCIWNTDRNQWGSPVNDISGVVNSMLWTSDTTLVVAGNLTIGKNQTKIFTFDATKNQFSEFTGARDLPGNVTAITAANRDGSQIWATGATSDGTPYLRKFDGTKWMTVPSSLFGQGTNIRGIQVLSLSNNHAKSDTIDQSQDLLILGSINVPKFGPAAAVLYNGTTIQPLLLSSKSDNTPGSVSQIFVENPQSFFKQGGKKLAVGFVVLIALAIALALTFLLVVAGILVEWYRKRSKGYALAPTQLHNTSSLPPERLFGTLSGPRAPAI